MLSDLRNIQHPCTLPPGGANTSWTRLWRLVKVSDHAARCHIGNTCSFSECERMYLGSLSELQSMSPRLFDLYLFRDQVQNEHDQKPWPQNGRGRALRLVLSFTEFALNHRLWGWLETCGGTLQRRVLNSIAKLHDRSSRYLSQLIKHRSEHVWISKTEPFVGRWDAGHQLFQKISASRYVHIAMVASVGMPTHAAKAMAGIRSALFFAEQLPIHFHLFVDRLGAEDLHFALDKLEPWLHDKGRFEFYGEDVFTSFLPTLQKIVPQDCLGYSQHFGAAGWVRLFMHEILQDRSEVDQLIFVDAGDYVFLNDAANALHERSMFRETHAIGAPQFGHLAFQLLDLPRMRELRWSKYVSELVATGYAKHGEKFCWLGEGQAFADAYNDNTHEWWHVMPGAWCFEPYEFGQRDLGMSDSWSQGVMQRRIYPGVRDWMNIHVHCTSFVEAFLQALSQSELPPTDDQVHDASEEAAMAHSVRLVSAEMTFQATKFKCNEAFLGIHFSGDLKSLHWVHYFLDFWAGRKV
eukprot:TRINITY_DN88956_c0_g1_i1.p1 TRINITY_DN88956_c0_g1~~TRINITY_DN88956_c0_g1_i1.p1  ORF type:complete len:522 (+),score=51.69 TRINITY_DN88956_c0_g1_i1:202-1767(+)